MALAVCATLVCAGSAGASTLKRSEQYGGPYGPADYDVVYTAAPGEANAVTLSFFGATGAAHVHDPGAKITAQPPACRVLLGDGYCSRYVEGAGLLGKVVRSPIEFRWIDLNLGDGNDRVESLPQADVRIWAGAGDDRVDTRGMRVYYLEGGPGADEMLADDVLSRVSYADHTDPVTVTLDGSPDDGSAGEHDNVIGFHFVIGGSGPDTIVGSAGRDYLDGGPGADREFGGDGNDNLGADPGDFADGGAGDDSIGGHGDGPKTLLGGSGNDTIKLYDGGGTVDAGPGDDSIEAWTFFTQLLAHDITCGPGDDTVHANPNDVIAADCEHVTIDANH
jgi:Ca2+-binding RTX toxin-like protein